MVCKGSTEVVINNRQRNVPTILLQLQPIASESKLIQIGWFFTKAGAFVFGSGPSNVPFLYGGGVKNMDGSMNHFFWTNTRV
jgi:hypothetical protein